ncbi:MAG: efflux RND transporter periplasmic adaptor subunit [Pseudomonadales bacterium]|nr:efflux RND transporter periplasmic adaptor subunit [Pseudomonadales bacterium]
MMIRGQITSAIGCLLLLLTLSACQQDPDVSSDSGNDSDKRASYTLQTTTVTKQSLPLIYNAPGTVTAKNHLQISSRITGYIDQINVSEGDRIQPGDLLVEIDGAQVEAAIKGAKAATRAARAELQDSTEDIKRYRALSETKVLAAERLQNAEFRQRKAEAMLAQAQAELDAREQDRRSIKLISPVEAYVRERLRDQGDLALAGEPILKLDILSEMELEIYLSAQQINAIEVGQAILISIPSEADLLIGTIKRIVRFADPITRRSKVLIKLPEGIELSPGQFARAEIPLQSQPTLVVPTAAITMRAGINGVFVLDENNAVHFESIRTGRISQPYSQVLSGVEEGWRLILNPPVQLKSGDSKNGTGD